MELMFTVNTPYKCSYCESDSLYFLLKHNRTIEYKDVFNQDITSMKLKQRLSRCDVQFLVCDSCGKINYIDWTNGFPVQADPEDLKKFTAHRE